MKPLTGEQKHLAEKYHDLVYKFLKRQNLSESQYYDIVIFGFLAAVQKYCEDIELQKYSFATIALKHMKRELFNYNRHLNNKKNSVRIVSLSDFLSASENSLRYEDVIVSENELLAELESDLLLHSLAEIVTQRQMRIVRMKIAGYKMHDIAKKEKMTFRDINCTLDDIYYKLVELF